MRITAILPAVLLLSALQLVAADYGSLSRVTISGKIYTPAPAPRVAPAADGTTTYIERQTVSEITQNEILGAMVTRSIIPSVKGYSLGLLTDSTLDGFGEFVAYRTAGPASAARRVPTDLLMLNYEVGPRAGTLRNTAADTLISIDLTSRDYAKLNVLDFEGTGILTRRYTNIPKQKAPLNQVVLSAAAGTFPGVNAPESGNAGLGTLSLSLSDAKIVDLTPYGNVAPSTPSSASGSTIITGSGSLTLGGSGTLHTGGTLVNGGNLTLVGGSTLSGNNTYTGGTSVIGGTLSIGGGTSTAGTIVIGGSTIGGNSTASP